MTRYSPLSFPALACLLALPLALSAVAVPAMTVEGLPLVGSAEIVDGDSLMIDGAEIDLAGVDAPELAQQCQRGGESWDCGAEARRQLVDFIGGRTVRCQPGDGGSGGTVQAVCTAGTLDLSGVMAESGLAVAVGSLYAADADRATRANRGLWAGEFQPPAEWRAANPAAAALASRTATTGSPRARAEVGRVAGQSAIAAASATAPAAAASSGCLIKGNRNRRGEWIYHLPGMPYYERTRAEEWFCSEAQAQAAGYRRAIVRY